MINGAPYDDDADPNVLRKKQYVVLVINRVQLLSLGALCGASLLGAQWKDFWIAWRVFIAVIPTIYVVAMAVMLYAKWKKDQPIDRLNAALAAANLLIAPLVFVVQSWMNDETRSQRAWLYCAQMLAVCFTSTSMYVSYQINMVERGYSSLFAWAGSILNVRRP